MKQQKEKIILLVSFVVFVFSSVATAQTKIYRSVQVNKTTDIDRDARPTPNYVDMGADEGVASPQSGTYRRQSFGQFPFGHRRR